MERLTHSGTKEPKNDVNIMQVLGKLAYYEDLEEQGRLLKLPSEIKKILKEDADTIEPLSAKLEEPKWIPCSDRLPPEPNLPPYDTIQTQIKEGLLQEYIVMIYGAEKPTTLWYAGNREWYDQFTDQNYIATAWQPLPEPYKPNNQAAVQEGDNQ